MARKVQPLKLTENEISSLTTLLSRGSSSARTNSRARILKLLHRGQKPAAIAAALQVTPQTVFNLKRRYLSDGLQAALFDRPRSGRPIRIDGKQRAKITALACSTPPEGRARWSLRLLADKAVELHYCQAVSHNAVKEILKKTNSDRI
jgi:putative transposase